MKKILVKIFSICLIIVCLFSLYLSVASVKDVSACKEYWEKTGDEALESISMLEDGIGQLKANQTTYIEGVKTFEEGLETYAEGKQTLAAGGATLSNGQKTYNDNVQKLAEAHKAYDEGVAQLEQGKKDVEAGKKMLAENEQAYNEGKAQLAKVEPIYNLIAPLYNAYLSSKAEYDKAVAAGDTAKAAVLAPGVSAADALVQQELAGTGYSISSLMSEVSAGKAKLKEYEDGLAKVQAGEKTIAEGEAKLAESAKLLAENDAKLADAKKTLDAGYASYAAGQAELEKGAAQLIDGKNQLAVYEDGQRQVSDGLNQLIFTETYRNEDGKALVKSIASRLGKGYTYWSEDGEGNIVLKNGEKLVNLDNAMDACTAGRDFVESTTEVVTKELYSRLTTIILAALAAILGILAGTMGFCEAINGSGFVGLASALAGFAGVIAALFLGGIEYPMSRIAGSTGTSFVVVALIVTAAAAVIYTVVAFICYETMAKSTVVVETAATAEE